MTIPPPGRWIGTVNMNSQRLFILIVLLIPLLASCSRVETPTPAAMPTLSLAALPTELPELELIITPGELFVDRDTVQTEPTAEPTVQPEASATPAPAASLRQLTDGGCCTEPFWSPDGQRILYIDRPSAEAQSGLWGVGLQGGQPEFITDKLGIYSPDMQLRATLVNGRTVVERLDSGEQWTIPNNGRAVSFSPDGTWVAWTAGQSGPPFDSARRQVWVSRFDGSQANQVFDAIRGGFGGWFPDGRLLVSGLAAEAGSEQAYWVLNLEGSLEDQASLAELGRGGRLREAKISLDGSWLAYMVSFSQDPDQDGIWLVNTHSGERKRLDIFGGYQWRNGERLLVVPLDLRQPVHQLLQVQADTGQVTTLTDPAVTPFKIANGDWSISPVGDKIIFLSAEDNNIWTLEIPDS
jgi:Tol biopolymer transport system component